MGVPGTSTGGGMRPPRVLIIEDDPSEARALHDLLVWNGFEAQMAATARHGWGRLRTWRPDVVVLDLGLPDADGLAVCRAIKADAQLRDVPVLILTGRVAVTQLVEGLRAGADDYVPKPYDPREVLARLHALLRRGRRIADLKTYHLRWWSFLKTLLPAPFLQALAQRPQELLGPAQVRPLSVVAVGWEGLSARLQEAMRGGSVPAGTLHQALNRHLDTFYESVLAEGGMPGPLMDSVAIAWFNAPLACVEHPVRALRASLAFRERVRRLHQGLPPALRFLPRLALHRGEALVGLMGGGAFRSYLPVGEVTETARRLALLAPAWGIVLSGAFHEAVRGLFPVLPWTEAPRFVRMPLYLIR